MKITVKIMSACAVLFGLLAFTTTSSYSGFFDDFTNSVKEGAKSAYSEAKKTAGKALTSAKNSATKTVKTKVGTVTSKATQAANSKVHAYTGDEDEEDNEDSSSEQQNNNGDEDEEGDEDGSEQQNDDDQEEVQAPSRNSKSSRAKSACELAGDANGMSADDAAANGLC